MSDYKIIILSHGEPREIVQECDSFLDAVSQAYKLREADSVRGGC